MSKSKKKQPTNTRPTIQNRQARYNYQLHDKFVAGIQLTGSEVKSLRAGKAQMSDAYAYLKKEEVWLKNLHIKGYENAGYAQHESDRERKLLLSKKEIAKLKKGLEQKGWTIVPLKLFFNKRNFVKIQIALASGKQAHDKRNTIKKRDIQRDIDRQLR